jgi:hypothetical protein
MMHGNMNIQSNPDSCFNSSSSMPVFDVDAVFCPEFSIETTTDHVQRSYTILRI